MKLNEFARLILFGTSLEEKLTPPSFPTALGEQAETTSRQVEADSTSEIPIEIPVFPGRPPSLSRVGKSKFPSIHLLREDSERAKVLHFFANHELLALELMALALLRFPKAPESFRMGIARIMKEEQSHLQLYILHMRRLGLDFGDLPISDYFWNAMKGMKSPLDFTVQMSLTFEQANLDFSLFFMKAIQKTGDLATAEILERVYLEEIGHVKHGLKWFNRWREDPGQTEWEAYQSLLPRPLSPERAKGFEFSSESREKAGFSEDYIRHLRVFSGSKGRPPVLWIFNPHCDAEIARGSPGFSPSQGAQTQTLDLEHIPQFLASKQDLVLASSQPNIEWLESIRNAGFYPPEIVEVRPNDWISSIRQSKIGGLQPWGWSPSSFFHFQPLCTRLVEVSGGNIGFCKTLFSHSTYGETSLGKLFSKSWSAAFLRNWLQRNSELQSVFGNTELLGTPYSDWDSVQKRALEILQQGHAVMLKAPYGTSGMQVRRLRKIDELDGPLGGWIRKVISQQGEILVEHALNKVFDLSIQFIVEESEIQILEVRRFLTGAQREYRGTYLGRRIPDFEPKHSRFLLEILPYWQRLVKELGISLRECGYLGPAGVDALLWINPEGLLQMKPLVELNPRWTMGRVALELEKGLQPGVSAFWGFLPLREIKAMGYLNAELFAQEMRKKYPLQMSKSAADQTPRIHSGILFTNDPKQARSVLTCLVILPNPEPWVEKLMEKGGPRE